MTKLTKVRSNAQPPEIEVTASLVLVASNIKEYEQNIEGQVITGYEYDYDIYSKDEYILVMAQKTKAIEQLQEQLEATKILLGVE